MVKFGSTTLPVVEHIERLDPKQFIQRPYPGKSIAYRKQVSSFGQEFLVSGVITSSVTSTENTIRQLADGEARIFDLEDGSDKILGILLDPRFRRRGSVSGELQYDFRIAETGSLKTLLLCHFDGPEGSASPIDSSHYGRALTCVGDAQLDTAQYVFGTASLLLDGNDHATVPSSTDFMFPGDFTINTRLRSSIDLVNSGEYMILSQYEASDLYWYLELYKTGGVVYVWLKCRDATGILLDKTWATPGVSKDTWYDLEIDRDGNDFYCFLSGTQCGSKGTASFTWPDIDSVLYIGKYGGGAEYFSGWFEELLMLSEEALHTEDFTPPSIPYDPDQF